MSATMTAAPRDPEQMEMFTAAIDSVNHGASTLRKQLTNWLPSRGSADSDLLPELGLLVSRSRDLARNHGLASGALQTLNDNIVGTGLRLACMPDYRTLGRSKDWADDWSRQVESLWHSWADTIYCDVTQQLNFSSMTALVFRSALMNGEALALPLWIPGRGGTFSTTMQLIESDRLSNPNNTPSNDRLRGGIEMDEYGKPVAYHIRKSHPGDLYMYGYGLPSNDWLRVPAETQWGRKRVVHVHDKERTGQTRGKPVLGPVLEQFKMFDAYQRTELQSAIVNALVAAVVETPMDQAALAEMMGGDPNKYLQTKGEYRVSLSGGSIIPLYPGDRLAPFTPSRPSQQYSQFVETILRHIGAALGMPYELVVKDFSKTNYSSARAALLEAWRFFNTRRQWLASYWATPVYYLWLEEAVNSGMLDAPEFYRDFYFYARCKWLGPGRGWIDPVKEAQAAQLRMETGISTLENECAEQGLDWQEVIEQRALEMERLKELGLWDYMAAANGAAAAQVAGTAEPEEDDDSEDFPEKDTDDEEDEEDADE